VCFFHSILDEEKEERNLYVKQEEHDDAKLDSMMMISFLDDIEYESVCKGLFSRHLFPRLDSNSLAFNPELFFRFFLVHSN
jgi:hypothetical protein